MKALFQLSPILPALLLLVNCSSSTDADSGDVQNATAGAATGASGSGAMGGSGSLAMGGSASGGSAAPNGTAGQVSVGGSPGSSAAGQGGAGSGGSPAQGGMNGQPQGGTNGQPQGGSSGRGGSNGQPQGGMMNAAGSGQAGAPAGGAGGSVSNPNDTTIAMTIPTASNGQGEIRTSTTVLKNAANGGKNVWDFNNQRIGVDNTADCENGEDQKTVFEVEDGVTVRNLIVAGGLSAGNGIVCKGNCTLEYVYWEDVCEDAATNSKDGATMTLNHVIALKAGDKVFQHNAKGGSKTIIHNSYISTFGKLWRSCGDCTDNGGPRHLEIDNVRVDGVSVAVAGANQNYGDTVTIRDLFVKGGYDASKDKPKICTEYIGVTDHNGDSTKVNDGKSQWNTAVCKLSQSDVKSY